MLLPSQMNRFRHVVRAVELVDHRCARVVAHPARAEQMDGLGLRLNRLEATS